MTKTTILGALSALFFIACSAEEPTTASEGNKDAPSSSDTKDDANQTGGPKTPDDSTQPDDKGGGTTTTVGSCNDAPPAALQQITSEFIASAAPEPKGGDEKGTWIYTKVTAYMPGTGAKLVDMNASKAEGTGFVKFDGKRFVTGSDMTQTISTKVTGTVVSSAVVKIAGTYAHASGELTVTPECNETTSDGDSDMTPKKMAFSRVSETEALFFQTADTQIGEVTIVTTMKKAN